MARSAARAAVASARAAYGRASARAFRAELAATVSSASPLLVALLRAEGLGLDEVVTHLVAAPGWPARPLLWTWDADPHALHKPDRGGLLVLEHPHGLRLPLTCGGVAHVQVAGHSLEVEIRSHGATFRTWFGLLRIVVPGGLPATISATALDLPVSAIVEHPLASRWDWRIAAVEIGCDEFTLTCRIGNVPYRPRQDG